VSAGIPATDGSVPRASTILAMNPFILAAEAVPADGWPGDDLTVVAWSLVVVVLLIAAVATALPSPGASDFEDHH